MTRVTPWGRGWPIYFIRTPGGSSAFPGPASYASPGERSSRTARADAAASGRYRGGDADDAGRHGGPEAAVAAAAPRAARRARARRGGGRRDGARGRVEPGVGERRARGGV